MGRKLKIRPKPLDKKEWDFWNERLTDFVMEVEHNVTLTPDEILDRGDKDMFETYLMGIVKGMWSVHKWIEDRMVENDGEEEVDKPKGYIKKAERIIGGRKRPHSEEHIKSIRRGIRRHWRNKKKDNRGKRLTSEGKKNIIRGIKRYWRIKRKSTQPEIKIYRELGKTGKGKKI